MLLLFPSRYPGDGGCYFRSNDTTPLDLQHRIAELRATLAATNDFHEAEECSRAITQYSLQLAWWLEENLPIH